VQRSIVKLIRADTKNRVKTQIKPVAKRCAVAEWTRQIACGRSLQIAIFVISILACVFCGVAGGYQFHLSHDHAALSCIQLSVPMTAGEQMDPQVFAIDPPPCKAPDEPGQPWRLKLVLLDMLGFVLFGTLGFDKSRRILFADPANRRSRSPGV